MAVECAEGGTGDPMVPAYEGGRLPLTTNLADRVRGLLQDPSRWGAVSRTGAGLAAAADGRVRGMPGRNDLLVETFPRGDRWYLVAYCFEGRNAHQTLGMLLTRRMERAGFAPLGFVATDYVLGIWSAEPPRDVAKLFDRGHAGRRPGSLDGGKLHAEADVSQCRGDRRADRAAPSGRGEDRAGR